MKAATKAALDKVEAAHDWQHGQTWGHGGTSYSSTSICRLCGMEWRWRSDKQNGVEDRNTFQTASGDDITLNQAVEMGCQ